MVGVSLNNSTKTDDKEQLVVNENSDVLVTILPGKDGQDEVIVPSPSDVRRKQTSMLFGCLSAFLMLGCLIIGTWLLFDFINRADHTWRRTCRFRIKPVEQDPETRVFFDHGGLTAFDDGQNQLLSSAVDPIRKQEFQQEVNLDLMKNLATVEVPQIGFSSGIRIIKDFDNNITVIRDFGVNRCFVMPLDRQVEPNPMNLKELLSAMMTGQLLPDNEVLRKTMKVKTPALAYEEVAKMGPIVTETCSSDIPTFRLVPKTAEEMKNRRRRSADAVAFVYSIGKRAILYDIE